MKAKLVKESLISKHLPLKNFLEWWNEIYESNPDQDWEWLLGSLENDESSTDDELLDYYLENGVPDQLALDLIEHRNGFLSYGLEIHI